jgi:hypothetical protein
MMILISKSDVAAMFPEWSDKQVTAFYMESFQFLHDKVESEAREWTQWVGRQWVANNIPIESMEVGNSTQLQSTIIKEAK